MLISLDDAPTPSYFVVALHANRTFSSVGGEQVLAGSWGLYTTIGDGRWSAIQPKKPNPRPANNTPPEARSMFRIISATQHHQAVQPLQEFRCPLH